MATETVQPDRVTDKLIGRWEPVGQKLVNLAEEVPEGKFDYRPVESVRTFAEVFRHVAFWNGYLADRIRGRKSDDTANELPREKFSTKKQILDALKQSSAEARSALKGRQPEFDADMAEMLMTFIEHNCEHYGQLVVYARLNGIVPPASQG